MFELERKVKVKQEGLSEGASQVVQGPSRLHEVIGDVLAMQTPGGFDNATPFDARQGVFDRHPPTGRTRDAHRR